MPSPGESRTLYRPARAGAVYALVLIVGMLLTVLALAGVSINRVNARSNVDSGDWKEAQMLAFSGVEHAMTQINADANWRTTYAAQTVQQSLGRGTFSWQAVDELDGNLPDNSSQPFVVLSTGAVGNASYTLHVTLTPPSGNLACGVYTPTTISLASGASIDTYNSTLGDYGTGNTGGGAAVVTNTTAVGGVALANNCQINGSVSVGPGGNPATVINRPANVVGAKTALTQAAVMPTVTAPANMGATTGNLALGNNQTNTINSDRHVTNLTLDNGAVLNISGNITILADGPVRISQNAQIHILPGSSLKLYFRSSFTALNNGMSIVVDGLNLSRLQLLGLGTGTVSMTNSKMEGVLIAPNSPLVMSSGAEILGVVVAKSVTMSSGAIHQDKRITTGVDPVNIGSTPTTRMRATGWSQAVH